MHLLTDMVSSNCFTQLGTHTHSQKLCYRSNRTHLRCIIVLWLAWVPVSVQQLLDNIRVLQLFAHHQQDSCHAPHLHPEHKLVWHTSSIHVGHKVIGLRKDKFVQETTLDLTHSGSSGTGDSVEMVLLVVRQQAPTSSTDMHDELTWCHKNAVPLMWRAYKALPAAPADCISIT